MAALTAPLLEPLVCAAVKCLWALSLWAPLLRAARPQSQPQRPTGQGWVLGGFQRSVGQILPPGRGTRTQSCFQCPVGQPAPCSPSWGRGDAAPSPPASCTSPHPSSCGCQLLSRCFHPGLPCSQAAEGLSAVQGKLSAGLQSRCWEPFPQSDLGCNSRAGERSWSVSTSAQEPRRAVRCVLPRGLTVADENLLCWERGTPQLCPAGGGPSAAGEQREDGGRSLRCLLLS